MKKEIFITIAIIITITLVCSCSNDFQIKTQIEERKNFLIIYDYYSHSQSKKVKHGLFRKIRKSDKEVLIEGAYIDGKRYGLWTFLNDFIDVTTCKIYYKNNIKCIEVFNSNGKKISSCTYKSNKPYNGTLWLLLHGLSDKGLVIKSCDITTYRSGEIVKTEECNIYGEIINESIFGMTYNEALENTSKSHQKPRGQTPTND